MTSITIQTAMISPSTARTVRTGKRMTRSPTTESIANGPDVLRLDQEESAAMSLHSNSIEQELTLPDGRVALLRIGMAHDSYIPESEEETVVLELRIDGHVAASINTVLDPEQDDEANELAREVIDALGSGHIRPTAAALEQYADRLR
jgi:hypothetical protein